MLQEAYFAHCRDYIHCIDYICTVRRGNLGKEWARTPEWTNTDEQGRVSRHAILPGWRSAAMAYVITDAGTCVRMTESHHY